MATKPDFLDMDKDGNKKEPMKKAIADKKKKTNESDYEINPATNKILTIGRKLQAAAQKEPNDMIANAMAKLATHLEDFGQPFGPKNMNDVVKVTGLKPEIIKQLIQKAQGANEGNAYAHAVRKAKMNGATSGDTVKGPDDKEITIEGLADMADFSERDHEVQMARAELYKIAKYALKLHDMLKGVSEAEGIQGWMQSKITKAADYVGSVYHTLEYDMVSENKTKKFSSTMTESEQEEYKLILEKAKSKAQQKFMGMVHAAKKGEKPSSKEVAKTAKSMPKKAAKDYASTAHKGLPKKK